jgi:hypothetical protein
VAPDGPIPGARYGHTNIIARDWRTLAAFYTDVFGCVFVPPEREYDSADLARASGVPDAALAGVCDGSRGEHHRAAVVGPCRRRQISRS